MADAQWLADRIRDVPDFPKPGVVFKDLCPLLGDGEAFRFAVDTIADHFGSLGVDKVAGVEARGFIFASPVAYRFGAGFVPMRKAGKLPWDTAGESYQLEYGSDGLEVHRDAMTSGDRVLIVDDVLATGGTAGAAIRLVERLGAEVVGLAFVAELAFLGGGAHLGGYDHMSLVTYP